MTAVDGETPCPREPPASNSEPARPLRVILRWEDLAAAMCDLGDRDELRLAVEVRRTCSPRVPETVSGDDRIPVLERPGRTAYVKVADIDWFEAESQYVRLHCRSRSMLVRSPNLSISSLARSLNPRQFIRVHRSHIVNLDSVEAIEVDGRNRHMVILRSGQHVPVSQQNWGRLRAHLSHFDCD